MKCQIVLDVLCITLKEIRHVLTSHKAPYAGGGLKTRIHTSLS